MILDLAIVTVAFEVVPVEMAATHVFDISLQCTIGHHDLVLQIF